MLNRWNAQRLRHIVQTALRRSAEATLGLVFSGALTVAAQAADALKAESLNLDKLNYEKELTALYLGDFANADMKDSGTT